jgi:Phage portal protein.
MEKIINDRFKKYFSRGNHVLPLFEGYEYKSETAESTKKYSNEVTDMKELVGEALARAAQAYKVPVGLIRGDVAGIKDAYTMLLTNCIDPIAAMLSEGFTTAVFSEEEIIDGCEIVADTSNLKHVDIFDMAGSIDKLIASGFLSIDEVRLASGLKPLNEEWSKAHYMTLNYTTAQASVEAGNEVTGADNDEGSEEE